MIFSKNMSTIIPIDMITLFTFVLSLSSIIFLIVVFRKLKRSKRKVISIWLVVWIGISCLLFINGTFGQFVNIQEVNEKIFTENQLQQDLEQIETAILDENPLTFSDEKVLKKQFKEAAEQIDRDMTEIEFFRLINPIITNVNCGHTNLQISEGLQQNRKDNAKFLPIKITLNNDQLYFVESNEELGINKGERIISINKMASEEIIRTLINNISHDGNNEAKSRYIIEQHFNNKYYTIIDSSGHYKVEYIDNTGETKSVMIKGDYRAEFNTSSWELHFVDIKDGNFYDYQVYDDYGKLNIYAFNEEKDEKFNEFLEEFFMEVENKNISKIIIDIRGNYGGSPKPARQLLSYLIDQPIDYFDSDLPVVYNLIGMGKVIEPSDHRFEGDIVVLMNRANFSTSGHLLSIIKSRQLATLVGTESSGGFVSTDSSKNLVLNNTRLRLHYSTDTYRVKTTDMLSIDSVQPHITVESSIEDVISNNDEQLMEALSILKI